MIKKIKLTTAKLSLRFMGIGLSKSDQAIILKLNEVIDAVNKLEKRLKNEE